MQALRCSRMKRVYFTEESMTALAVLGVAFAVAVLVLLIMSRGAQRATARGHQ